MNKLKMWDTVFKVCIVVILLSSLVQIVIAILRLTMKG